MRIHNEGAGKSSWWVVNPDVFARAAKTPRRPRAFTLDPKSYERQGRSRTQRQNAATRGTPAVQTQRTTAVADSSSLVAEEPRDPFGLEYRTRASSFGGRLSPIDARSEPDTMDYSPLMRFHYDGVGRADAFPYGGAEGHETLSETLADILAGDLNMSDVSSTSSVTNAAQTSGYGENGYDSAMPYLRPVNDVYHESVGSAGLHDCRRELGSSGCGSNSDVSHYGRHHLGNVLSKGIGSRVVNAADYVASGSMPNLSQLLTAPLYPSPYASQPDNSCMFEGYQPHLRDISAIRAETGKASSCGMMAELGGTGSPGGGGSLASPDERTHPAGQRLDRPAVARILAERPHLIGMMQKLIHQKREQMAAEQQQHYQFQRQSHLQQQAGNVTQPVDNFDADFPPPAGTSVRAVHVPPASAECPDASSESTANAFFPSDLDLNGLEFAGAAMECDIDQVIRHELALDGKLDFMFDSLPTPTRF